MAADDDTIRSLLSELPRLSTVRKPGGFVAISYSDVIDRIEEMDLDIEGVTAWVTERGGRVRTPPPVQSQTLGRGRRLARTVPGDPYYVIPLAALTR